jgi:hypothetical protein
LKPNKSVIGRSDYIDLPAMGLFQLKAKVDTGAYTSAIHYHHAEVVEKDGKEVLHFTLLDPTHPEYNDKSFYFADFETREIKNSFGQSEERFIINAKIVILGKKYLTEFSLSNRGNLKFPILLGRKLLRKNFIVDVSKKNISLKLKNREL